MRIGLISGEFPPMEGGVGAFTEQLALAIRQAGHDVHVITSSKAKPADAPRKLTEINEPLERPYGWLHARINRWRAPALATIVDVAIRYELDVLNLQYQAAAYSMKSPAINFLPWRAISVLPVVVTFHDLRVPYLFPKAGPLRERVLRLMARRASGCIATNESDFRALGAWGVATRRQIPIGSNIDTYHANHIEIAEIRMKMGLSEGDVLLGYFGFVSDAKGAGTLIQALAQLDSHYHLAFIGGQTGDSDLSTNQQFGRELQQEIERTGLAGRVHWTGFLPGQRVSAHLAAADLMVMPYRDGVSLRRGTLMAILAHGRPLLTTEPQEPSAEFDHGRTMWLAPPDDPVALSEAIEQLMADPALRAEIASGGEELAQSFGWDNIARKTLAFYEEVIAASPRKVPAAF